MKQTEAVIPEKGYNSLSFCIAVYQITNTVYKLYYNYFSFLNLLLNR